MMIHMTPEEKQIWNTCVAFHGHVCAGLLIGFKASLYAMELLDLNYYREEEVSCISETDTCGVDSIQVALGCSVGKGNLHFHLTGKQAFSFYNRKTGQAVRLVLRPIQAASRMEHLVYINGRSPKDLFDVKTPSLTLPKQMRTTHRVICSLCGEEVAEHMLCMYDGKLVCVDCLNEFDRFHL